MRGSRRKGAGVEGAGKNRRRSGGVGAGRGRGGGGSGVFIVVEGPEGAGKTTLVKWLAARLLARFLGSNAAAQQARFKTEVERRWSTGPGAG